MRRLVLVSRKISAQRLVISCSGTPNAAAHAFDLKEKRSQWTDRMLVIVILYVACAVLYNPHHARGRV